MIKKYNQSTPDKQQKKKGTKPCGCGGNRTLPRKAAADNGNKNTGSATAPSNE